MKSLIFKIKNKLGNHIWAGARLQVPFNKTFRSIVLTAATCPLIFFIKPIKLYLNAVKSSKWEQVRQGT